jgi:hypothetical protein
MLSIDRALGPEEQSAIGRASVAAIHAMSAKVGEAARASTPPAPRAGDVLALLSFAAEYVVAAACVVIYPAPDRLSPFPAVAGSSGI